MRGAAGEDEVGAGIGERERRGDLPEAARMPGDGDVGILEGAGADHEGLGGAAFLGRAAVIADAAGQLVLGEPVLHGGRRQQGGRAEQVVTAAMAMAAHLDLAMLGDAGFLTEAGQGVVLAEEGDDRAAFAGLADHCGRDVGDVFGDPEALVLQLGDMLGDRALLGVADLGNGPDPVAEFDETLFAGVDVTPEVVAIVHVLSRWRGKPRLLFASARPCVQQLWGMADLPPGLLMRLIFGTASA